MLQQVSLVPMVLPRCRDEIFGFLEKFQCEASSGPATVMTSPQDSVMSTSAESNKAAAKNSAKASLVRIDEAKFLEFYGLEQFHDLTNAEYKSQFSALLNNQIEITRHLRASVIDWLFEVGTKLKIEDRSVLFQAFNLMDRFYDK
jgi:hypothetical protein